jgi:tRNA-dihydrouridine synthase
VSNSFSKLPRPFFVLAPMDDVTDSVFRQIVVNCAAPDLFFSEFVNADGLQSPGRPRLLKKLQFTPSESPLIAQVWGKNPDNFYRTARQIADGTFVREFNLPEDINYAGIDLNMGCPVKQVIKNGCCSALINDRNLAVEIIRATQEGVRGKLPISVKTRLGFNEIDYSWHELLLQQKLNMLTIHGRTKKDLSKVPADWSAISHIRELRDELAPATLIVGNGDVETRAEGLRLAAEYKLDGVMIGRGVLHDPFVFAESSKWHNYTKQQKLSLFSKHVKLFAKTWPNGEYPIHVLNKFCKIYVNGFDGAKELREELMHASNVSQLLGMLVEAAE